MTNEKDNVLVKQGGGELAASGGEVRVPFVDIYETEDGLRVVAEMPGVDAESVSVEVEKGVLTIGGQVRRADLAGFSPIYDGLPGGDGYFRAFALSDEVDRDKTTASMSNGVLTVVLPKAPQARTRKIPVAGSP